jgi:succinate-semialdehyde dehydrogenase/glutarate-semialdehyde dehydrogenase
MADYAVINPATGETVREYETISDDGLRDAIASAYKASQEWVPTTTVQERADMVRRVGELHTERRQQLAETITREMGKPIEQSLGEVDFCVAIYDYYADNGPKLLADEPVDLLEGAGSAFIRRSPFGVLLGIMPWNYPYYQVARFAGPNLVVGNTILLKHAPQCPESASALSDIFHEAGFPGGAYTNIFATNEQIEWVIADPRVRGVSLTGSERAGAAVAEIAGRNLKKVVLELGGSDPFILLSTDDLDATVEAAVGARLENTGQACNAAKRFIVSDDLYEPFLEKFTAAISAVSPGDPTSSDSTIGPLSSTLAADRLDEQVKRAISQGAKVAAGGGEKHGNFYPATVLTDITPDNDAYHEELFGPVASVYKVTSEAESVV